MNIGELVKATAFLYFDCAKRATVALKNNLIILVGAVAAFFVHKLTVSTFADFGFTGGFVIAFVDIALLSYFYGWLNDSQQDVKFTLRDLVQFDYQLFFNVMSVAFVLFIAQYLVAAMSQGMGPNSFGLIVQLGIVIVFNSIPEVIYIHRYENIHALGHAATFTRENWIEWFIPLLIVCLPLLLVSPQGLLYLMAQSEELLPAMIVLISWQWSNPSAEIVFILIGLVVSVWFMLFRGFLFRELESGSRRQRAYQAKHR